MPNLQLIDRFRNYISEENLFTAKESLLIAVSGGVDSIVLCELCHQCKFTFNIAHVNFQLRGVESDEDADFVRTIANKYQAPLFETSINASHYADEQNISIQVAARNLRYKWFEELIDPGRNLPFKRILTAHHADDNIETILMNLFKGSGINGLKGILPLNNNIARPLLFASKEEIVHFANEHQLQYREDSSNSSDKYTRNYFRNELIPGIEKVFPSVKQNLINNIARFRDINIIYNSSVQQIIKKLVAVVGDEVHIPVLKLMKTPGFKTILFEIINQYGFASSQLNEVIKLIQSQSGKYVFSKEYRILKNRKWLIISKTKSIDSSIYTIERSNSEIQFSSGILTLQILGKTTEIIADNKLAQLNLAEIQFPLLLRKWKKGDYFYPLGMQKKKKLSRFFSDIKLSLNDKADVWVIESNKKIIWVIGHRIDNRFKVTATTKDLLQINWLPAK